MLPLRLCPALLYLQLAYAYDPCYCRVMTSLLDPTTATVSWARTMRTHAEVLAQVSLGDLTRALPSGALHRWDCQSFDLLIALHSSLPTRGSLSATSNGMSGSGLLVNMAAIATLSEDDLFAALSAETLREWDLNLSGLVRDLSVALTGDAAEGRGHLEALTAHLAAEREADDRRLFASTIRMHAAALAQIPEADLMDALSLEALRELDYELVSLIESLRAQITGTYDTDDDVPDLESLARHYLTKAVASDGGAMEAWLPGFRP